MKEATSLPRRSRAAADEEGYVDAMNRRRALVVEDDDRFRSLIVEALTDAGFGVSEAANLDQALTLLSAPGTPGYRVVIVDCRLRRQGETVWGGVHLVRTMDLRWPWIPIVAMTGATPAEDMIIEAFRHGATDFLKKPFSLDELMAGVHRATARHRRRLTCGLPGIGADAPAGGPLPDPEVEGIVAAINRLYAGPLRVRDVAARVGIRPARVSRIFRAATGLSVTEYIHSVRLARAEQLLATSDWSMTEIALAVGFYDLPHLDKAFHKWFGISPSDFRKRATPTRIAGTMEPGWPRQLEARSLDEGAAPSKVRSSGIDPAA